MGLALEFKDVHKTYKGVYAVRGLSFSLEESTALALLGPNGAGKSTLMNMATGRVMRDSSGGKINIFGSDPKDNSLRIKYLSGVVPQEENLDDELNVFQNLYVYSRFYGIKKQKALLRIEELLDFMNLSEKRNAGIKELSGGMRRRLLIARALLNRPSLLILDEPTTGLDPQARNMIWDRLNQLKKSGTSILLSTHYM
ncbi:MAG: ABC transporter ATP-binding protein, partial [Elusimicrobia bacterium]|nr:ABC transporter ATP-binding protein [Elusimicrobiota bacterium]